MEIIHPIVGEVVPMSYADRFKSPEGAEKYRAAYDATLALWPVPHEALDITTSFGMTHINTAGAPDLPPLVMIHGAQVNSTQWYPNIEPLSRHFRVYALDVVDQMGMSVPTRGLKTARDCADWLTEVLDGLHLEKVTIAGHSQGGWQAINMALRNPQRVERLVLLAPGASFMRMGMKLLFRMLPVFIRPTKSVFYWCFQGMTTMPLGDYDPITEQFMIGAKAYKPGELSLGVASVFSDDELRSITIPTLLLIGDHEIIYNPNRALECARRLMPHLEAELIANGGHLFTVDQAEVTNTRMMAFLTN